ncbi:unnamed protein product [Parascedosporium putredinis]|uniref:alpha-1,2-Mannosidase n=1 Tax=Parascedosporium putredinis TaxID=1442378 RepID=A0A9P1MBC7_9PEZI|nr:unnamed protein product [Parascedosporium putredinis]CAI7998432.1 unnamed protein product [Parascedosporium putredinis]
MVVHGRVGPRPRGNTSLLHNVQDKVEGLFETRAGGLPMYKDKPYTYGASRKIRPMWRRRRVLAFLGLAALLTLMYLNGAFSRDREGEKGSVWGLGSFNEAPKGKVDWEKRRQHVVDAFEKSWDAYERYAWGYDEFHPVSKGKRQMAKDGLGWIIIDSLDTMMLMNQTKRLSHAREWLQQTLTWDQDQDVNTFETTIRMLGGLLSAHYLSTEFPNMAPVPEDAGGEDLYLEKAKDLADRLIVAFDSPPTATLQLEFKYLAKLTGEKFYWDKVEKVMQVIDDNGTEDGLVPIFIYPDSGKFKGRNVRLGSRGDSYYEYLIKQYLQTNKAEPIYEEMWTQALDGVRRHLVTYTEHSGFTIIAERPEGLDAPLSPKMDHLARKLATWTRKDEEDMKLAAELTHTCWATYKYMATGLAAEITHFNVNKPPLSEGAAHPTPPSTLDGADLDAPWRADFIVKPADAHNLQRPETVESLVYMWRITKDVKYREWGWEMFMSFMDHTAVEDGGFSSLTNANTLPPVSRDNMESFWLIVFNTEAHPLPRFEMGRLFSTGWNRKPRDRFGKIVQTAGAEGTEGTETQGGA